MIKQLTLLLLMTMSISAQDILWKIALNPHQSNTYVVGWSKPLAIEQMMRTNNKDCLNQARPNVMTTHIDASDTIDFSDCFRYPAEDENAMNIDEDSSDESLEVPQTIETYSNTSRSVSPLSNNSVPISLIKESIIEVTKETRGTKLGTHRGPYAPHKTLACIKCHQLLIDKYSLRKHLIRGTCARILARREKKLKGTKCSNN